jgi:hypothetical protein
MAVGVLGRSGRRQVLVDSRLSLASGQRSTFHKDLTERRPAFSFAFFRSSAKHIKVISGIQATLTGTKLDMETFKMPQ